MKDRLISIEEARERVLAAAGSRLAEESVEIDLALDRVLATDLFAAADVPAYAASAMDGFALSDGSAPGRFAIVGEARAGAPYAGALRPGEAVRISTGAVVPAEAVAVIRQEDTVLPGEVDADDGEVDAQDGEVETRLAVKAGANIRPAGGDMRRGDLVLESGTRLGAGELGAAIAAGAATLTVARRPRVAVVVTGDELRRPGEPLGPGQIHNSNGTMLRALATHAGASAGPATILGDDAATTDTILARALAECDVLIVSGGVSVGPHDHVKPALARLGIEQHFWGVALQPGQPTWFGSRERQLVFALPGNPVSAAVTFSLFTRPALSALQGARPDRRWLPEATLGTAVPRNATRDRVIRVRLEADGGRLVARPTGRQDSHLVTSLHRADSLAVIPRGAGELAAGERVSLEPLPR